jgi:hypothetical protein
LQLEKPQSVLLLLVLLDKLVIPSYSESLRTNQLKFKIINSFFSGEMLGKDQPVILQLLELPGALKNLEGVNMELLDCAFPLLQGVVQTSDVRKAFEGADYALLVGAKPRSKGKSHSQPTSNI